MLSLLGGLLSRFGKDRRGSVLPLFAVSLIPLVGLVGAAVDYSRASSAKVAMQAALDATALAMSNNVRTLSAIELQTKSQAYFNALFSRTEVGPVTITATFTTTGVMQLVVDGSTSMKTQIVNLIGFPALSIAASSTVIWGNARLRVGLVLDTTGSMDDSGKIEALRTATKDLLTQLQAAASAPEDVYVSIIPFSKNVNVGTANYNATWVDFTEWEDEPPAIKTSKPSGWSNVGPGSSCPFSTSTHGFRCTTGPVNGSSNASNIPSSGTYSGYICPSVDSGGSVSKRIGIYYNGCYNSVTYSCTGSSCSCSGHSNCSCSGNGNNKVCKQPNGYYEHTWLKNARSTWNGCITDRGTASAPSSSDYDRKVTAADPANAATLYPAEQNSYCSPAVMALNNDWATMKAMADDLYPLGATNQPIGLVTGWQSLVGGGPFPTPPAKDTAYTYNEVIVLMSDGLNTLDRWYGNGSSTSTSVDGRMLSPNSTSGVGTCKNVKDAGFTIYTIHVNTEGGPASTLLQNCAGPPTGKPSQDKYSYVVTSASGIGTVFNQIGTQLSKLRLAK